MTTTYSPQFLAYFDRLIGHEGVWTIDERDPGNWTGGRQGVGTLKGTKYGIAANTYPDLNIRDLTLDDAREIYHRDWWLKLGADELPPAVSYQVWQFAVNAGMGTAKRGLQFAVGVAQDGRIGPITLAAVKRADLCDILLRFNSFVLEHYAALSTFHTFGRGWTRRVAANLRYAAIDNDTAAPAPQVARTENSPQKSP
jgi:lysozyme family protein